MFARTLTLVLLYYSSSIGLTFYQKWLLKVPGPSFRGPWTPEGATGPPLFIQDLWI